MANGMWKQEARDSIEEPSQCNEKMKAYRILPSAPQKHMYTDNYNRPALDPWECARSVPYIACPEIIFGKIGLHYYNQQKAKDPILNFSCEFVAQVRHAVENKHCLSAITTRCRLKPKTPEEEEKYSEWNEDAVDAFFKGDMLDWLPEDGLTARDKLQYYEMKESEIEQEKEWLHTYAELALFSKRQSNWVRKKKTY